MKRNYEFNDNIEEWPEFGNGTEEEFQSTRGTKDKSPLTFNNYSSVKDLSKITSTSILDWSLNLYTGEGQEPEEEEEEQLHELNLITSTLRKCRNVSHMAITLPASSQIQTLDETKPLHQLFAHMVKVVMPNVKSLHISGPDFTYHPLQDHIFQHLMNSYNLGVLKIECTAELSTKALFSICQILRLNYTCNILEIISCEMKDEDANSIFKSLYRNTNLLTLNLMCNNITCICPHEELKTLFRRNSTLITLNLNNNPIEGGTVLTILKSASHNSSIENLLLDGSTRIIAVAKVFNESTFYNTTLKVLSLVDCGLGQGTTDVLIKLLKICPLLEGLNCSHNPIGDFNFRRLSKEIIKHTSLEVLFCCSNFLTDASVDCIIDLVLKNSKLDYIYYYRNDLTKQALYKIFSVVSPESYIKSFENPKEYNISYEIDPRNTEEYCILAENHRQTTIFFGSYYGDLEVTVNNVVISP